MDKLEIIDIHTHILPQVDDGSSDMEETIKMLKLSVQQGIKTIIATPHYGLGYKEKSVQELQNIKIRVEEEAAAIDLDVRIYMGNEIYYTESSVNDVIQGKALTLADSRYVLIEFSVGINYKTLYQGLRQFIHGGYAPILAHVERYQCLMEDEERIEELIELGVYIQMNGSSLSGSFFSKSLARHKRLIKNRWIHMIATDCHDSVTRAPILEQAVQAVIKLTNMEYAKEIFCINPGKILENKYI
jgi:protein-tyrosine phosphatase